MRDFYEHFYRVVQQSPVHAAFCTQSFGMNLCQHGFADLAQLQALLTQSQLSPGKRLLDLGCGNGRIAEYISDQTGAQVTGLDYIPEAIRQAQARTAVKRERLTFAVGDINALDLPTATFDAIISIDTIYFSNDYPATISQLARALRPGGQLFFFYSYGWEPGMAVGGFPSETLQPDQTPLASALQANRLCFTTQDFTAEDCRMAQQRKAILEKLKPQFEAEGIQFIYANRMGECHGIRQGCELGWHRRYLYQCHLVPQ
ncbi:MAG: class I SAM-dependent methyltransferase [Caldilineaceae bacterium]